ncbi:MAG: hypothetical protein ACRDSJ_13800 [Rubrobacteraceae bacterium]
MDGRCDSECGDFDENAGIVHASEGCGRDHRRDLNQAALELIAESRANSPMMTRPPSGGASGKTSFEDAIERRVGRLRGGGPPGMVVADSAGFARECLAARRREGLGRVMSAPSTAGEARGRLEDADPGKPRPLARGRRRAAFSTTHAGVGRRWLAIYSEAGPGSEPPKRWTNSSRGGQEEREAFDEPRREALDDPEALRARKGQSGEAERGFRVLKDPMFPATALRLERVERVMAPLMATTARPVRRAAPRADRPRSGSSSCSWTRACSPSRRRRPSMRWLSTSGRRSRGPSS